jgi:CheY-like chemotaxis protein
MQTRKRVLIVEDDRVVKSSLARLLEGGDCHIDSASTGNEGLTRFQREPYDLVLTDLKLPDMDGMDMVEQMRECCADLPFVVLTAFGNQDDARRALQMGAVDFFQKPLDAQQILNVAQTAFQSNRTPSGNSYAEAAMNPPSDPKSKPDGMAEQLICLQGLLAPYASIGRLGSGITHNLNGFLTGLMGHLELLKMKRPDLETELVSVMDLAKKIRDNVADLSNKFDNETQAETQPLNLNQILRSELAFLQADLFFKHYVSVRLELEESLPSIWGRYADYSLVLEEIIINAIDAQRDKKAGEIRIKTWSDETSVYVEIEDNGPGFSPQALEHAVEPLWPGIKESEDGLVRAGMGLFMARRRLETWGGSLKLANSESRGGLVTIALPRRDKPPV